MTQKLHISLPQLAKLLGISHVAAYQKVKKGQIQGAKIGRNYVVGAKKGEYISIPQLAMKMGITRDAVYKQVKKGVIKAIKVGRNYVIPKKQLGLYEKR